jgi:predicted MFS family arabinose efflux permease
VCDDSSGSAAGLVAGLFLVSVAAAAYEITPSSVLSLIQDSLGVSPTAAGALISVMYAISVLLSLPAGALIDRVGPRRMVTAAGVALAVAGLWGWAAATAGSYLLLLLSRVLGGACYVVVWNAGANVAGNAVSPEHRATAVGVFTASAPVGFSVGLFGAPVVAAASSWPVAFPVFATGGLLGVGIFLFSSRGRSLGVDAETPDRAAFQDLFSNRTVWLLSILCFLGFALYLFLNSWLPSYLSEGLGLSLAASGLLTALFPAVGIVARTVSGALSDRLFDGRRRPVVLGAFLVATPGLAAFVLAETVPAIVALLLVVGFAVQATIGLLFTYVAEVVAPAVRSTAVALLTSVGLLGAFLAPLGAGVIIEAVGYQPAFLTAAVVAAVAVAVAWVTPEAKGIALG